MATVSKKTKASAAAQKQPAEGAVTLEQAKALIAARAPMRSAAAAAAGNQASAAPEAPTLGEVARDRKQLKQAQRRERKQRIQDYKAVMQLMQQRGVKGIPTAAKAVKAAKAAKPAGAGPSAPRAPAAAAAAPLRILAEGDSWFDYPVPFFGGGIVPRLEKLLGLPILNMAKAGDEVRFMMGVEERKQMTQRLRDGSPSGGAWDVLLFSGGGNDIVSNPMALWVRDFAQGTPPEKLIHRARYDAAIAIVRAGYEDLIAMRDSLSPQTQLVFHAYDFAVPDGRGICHIGPWLKPTFDLRGFPSQQAGFQVVKLMLSELAKMLSELETTHPNVSFVNGQGTLAPVPENWHNELHPSKQGFQQFAGLFHTRLKALFPNRVPGNIDG
jgi:hypothetical protein